MEKQLKTFLDVLAKSERLLVFTGAGISTESGIADFRSPGGIWSRIKPIPFDRFLSDPEARLEDWTRRFHFKAQYEAAKPNEGHNAVVQFERAGRLLGVVTQNIDGLHQRAGLDANRIVELHGSGLHASCLSCHAPKTLEAVRQAINTTGTPPDCARCGGVLKADVVSFGQAMPKEKMRQAVEWAQTCDAVLVLGSSLVVEPAASIPSIAAQNGASLLIVNREATPLDNLAAVCLQQEIGATMQQAVQYLG